MSSSLKNDIKAETNYLLIQWGAYGIQHNLQYKSWLGKFAGKTKQRPITITDQEFQEIDAVVSRIRLISDRTHEFAKLYYIKGYSLRSLADYYKMTKSAAEREKAFIVDFVMIALNEHLN